MVDFSMIYDVQFHIPREYAAPNQHLPECHKILHPVTYLAMETVDFSIGEQCKVS